MGAKEYFASALQNPNVQKMLDLLGHTEGTDKLYGYKTLVGGKKVDDLSSHPNIVGLTTKDGPSTAFGRYQITGTTNRGLEKQYGIVGMSPHAQDLKAVALMAQRGALKDVMKGDFSGAINKLGSEWASLPTSTTANQGHKSWQDVQKFLGAKPTTTFSGGTKNPVMPSYIGAGEFQTTFQQQLAASQPSPSEQIANVYQAYQSGDMTPEEKAHFEQDVKSGKMMLPRGASLQESRAADFAAPIQAPQGVLSAYQSGEMTRQEKMDFERDVAAGAVKVPQGFQIEKTESLGVFGGIKEAFTGNDRRTAQTDALPDWTGMPELSDFSKAGLKTGIGTMFSSPAETIQVIKANYPGVEVTQDAKGNYLMKSSKDGQMYAIKPGFQVGDIPRALGGILAFTPAGRAETILGSAAGSAATQAAIEGSQAATGGEFNTGEVLTAGALGAAVPAAINTVKAVAAPVKTAINSALGREAPVAAEALQAGKQGVAAVDQKIAQAADDVRAPTQTPAPEVPQPVPVAPMTGEELATTARTAAEGGFGSKKATQILAEQAAPDIKTVDAAKRLGIEDFLQPDHVTTNQAYRELSQAVKSIPGSEARAAEMQGLEQIGKRANNLIDDIGGTTDLSTLDVNIKSAMRSTQQELEGKANQLYGQLRESIPAKAEAPAPNVLNFIAKRADELGGAENLSPMERTIMKKLSPRGDGQAAVSQPLESMNVGGVKFSELPPNIQQQIQSKLGGAIESPVVAKQPTYALLDDVRRDLTAARIKGQGAFKDADAGLIKKLEFELKKDQAAVVEQHGMGDVFKAAQSAVAIRKGLEDDMISLFGKEMDKSITPAVSGAVKALPAGDASKFIKLIKSVPEEMRQQVVASGLSTAFGKQTQNGALNFNTYANWYEGLLKNKQSYTAVMSNLPAGARKQLSDLYRVSKGVSAATKERITTGRIQAVAEQLKGADNLVSNIYGLAKRASAGVAAEAITTPLGIPGSGIAAGIASALTKGKTQVMKAADALIASPEFAEAVKAAGTSGEKTAVRKLAFSKAFTKYVRALGNPKALSNREKWIVSMIQTENAMNQNKPTKKEKNHAGN